MRNTTLIMTLCLIVGCGMKGPLYLPEEETAGTQTAGNADNQDTPAREEEEEDSP